MKDCAVKQDWIMVFWLLAMAQKITMTFGLSKTRGAQGKFLIKVVLLSYQKKESFLI